MLIKTVLNRVHPVKGFVVGKVEFADEVAEPLLKVRIRPRKGSQPWCSGCLRRGATYDHLPERLFEFVPLWAIPVYFLYAMRRVNCRHCGVTVEAVPWALGKRRTTRAYAVFLARWARRLSWSEVAEVFHTTWENVYCSVKWVVDYGLEHRDLSGITALGIDEVQFRKGHQYLTLVYQIDAGCRRLLWIGKDRTAKTLLRFFKMFGRQRTARIRFVCSDMWRAYLKVIAKKAGHALHILDRYHIVANLNKAVDKVRAGESRRMKQDGYEPILKHTRWCFLKREENLSDKQRLRLQDVLRYDLKTVRAYLLKESFQGLWAYVSPSWAGWFLDRWVARAMRSRLNPVKRFACSVREHRELILNWFRAKKQFSCGIVEGLNYNVKLTIRKAFGFSNLEYAETALYHTLGQLPEPQLTHRFC